MAEPLYTPPNGLYNIAGRPVYTPASIPVLPRKNDEAGELVDPFGSYEFACYEWVSNRPFSGHLQLVETQPCSLVDYYVILRHLETGRRYPMWREDFEAVVQRPWLWRGNLIISGRFVVRKLGGRYGLVKLAEEVAREVPSA